MSKTESVKKISSKSVREVLALNFNQKLTTDEIEQMECELLKMLELLVNVELSNFKEIANESCYFTGSLWMPNWTDCVIIVQLKDWKLQKNLLLLKALFTAREPSFMKQLIILNGKAN